MSTYTSMYLILGIVKVKYQINFNHAKIDITKGVYMNTFDEKSMIDEGAMGNGFTGGLSPDWDV